MMVRLWTIFIGVCLAGTLTWSVLNNQGTNTQLKQVSDKLAKAGEDQAALETKYKDLESDRDNVLAQTKVLLKVQSDYNDLKTVHAELEKTNQSLESQRMKLIQYNEKADKEKTEALQKLTQLDLLLKQTEAKVAVLGLENKTLKSTAAEMAQRLKVESSLPEPKEGSTDKQSSQDAGRSKTENEKLKKENSAHSKNEKELSDNLRKALDRIKELENRGSGAPNETADLRKKAQALEAENKKLKDVNKVLTETNKTLADASKNAPKQFKDIAKENDTLKKETGRMHYNMGVLFLDNKNQERALQEFQRALDFDPGNSSVHYNLGVLYADMEQHDKAMAHFRRFLELDPRSKQASEAQNYLVEREAYGDKESKI